MSNGDKVVMKIREAAHGVTLIELLVVIAIVAIVAAFAAPGLRSMIEKMRLEGDQSALVQALKEAKRIARAEGTTVSVVLKNSVSSNSTVTLRPDNAANKVITLASTSLFDSEQTVTFLSSGTVTPPAGAAMFRLIVKNSSSGQKRYVEVTGSGQITGHSAGYTP